MMKAVKKSPENTNTKTKTMTKTTTKTKTQKKCLKHPPYAIFLKSWWLTHSKYDDRYLTMVIVFKPVTLVTLFRSYDQFYRAECITVSGFFTQQSRKLTTRKHENKQAKWEFGAQAGSSGTLQCNQGNGRVGRLPSTPCCPQIRMKCLSCPRYF